MKLIIVSILTLTILFIASFQCLKVSEAEVNSLSQIAQTSPTPTKKKIIEEKPSPSPTPICSVESMLPLKVPIILETSASPTPVVEPTPTPLSEEERQERWRDLTHQNQPDPRDSGFESSDLNCDRVINSRDNCPYVYNPNQKNSRNIWIGDACDRQIDSYSNRDSRCDQDRDGISDEKDNCSGACNPDQKDVNKNGIGDVCDRSFPNPVFSQVCAKPRKVKAPKPSKFSTMGKN